MQAPLSLWETHPCTPLMGLYRAVVTATTIMTAARRRASRSGSGPGAAPVSIVRSDICTAHASARRVRSRPYCPVVPISAILCRDCGTLNACSTALRRSPNSWRLQCQVLVPPRTHCRLLFAGLLLLPGLAAHTAGVLGVDADADALRANAHGLSGLPIECTSSNSDRRRWCRRPGVGDRIGSQTAQHAGASHASRQPSHAHLKPLLLKLLQVRWMPVGRR